MADDTGFETEGAKEDGGGDVPSWFSSSSKLPSDPELDNFLHRVDDISMLIKGLASSDPKDQERALRKADIFLHEKELKDIDDPEKVQCKVTKERSQINKIPDKPENEGDMSQEAFKRIVEKDANERAENRRIRKEKSDELRKKGNILFSKQDFAGALYNYNEAIKLIKDSPCLYNNRALVYLRLGLYSSVIEDCDKALLLETYSFRARMYKAKAYFLSGDAAKCRSELETAREVLPGHVDMINDYENEIFNMGRESPNDDHFTDQEKTWRDAGRFTGEFASKSDTENKSSDSFIKSHAKPQRSTVSSSGEAETESESPIDDIGDTSQST